LGVYREKIRGAAEGESPRQQKAEEEKDGGCNSKKIMGSQIKSVFQDNTLKARWF
ncbi:hypothetical protein Tco_0074338, partial [Tanacetum coccineum]